MIELAVVLPVRLSADRLDILDRLSFCLLDDIVPNNVEFTVVDDGSSASHSALIQETCKKLGVNYLKIDSEGEHFSVGRVRNFAAQHIDTKFIMFQDVDLMPYSGFYRDALNECYIQELDKFADRFVMFGVIYLTQEASLQYLQTDVNIRKHKFINYMFEDNKDKIEKSSTGTSVTIWRRDHYLCTGGNDPDFEGWGFEDLEYACRAIRRNRKFPMPHSFNEDYRNFMTIQEFKGWKSVYRLYGDITFQKGMVLFHYWHPVDTKSKYIKQKENNRIIFNQKMVDFAKEKKEPDYLPKVSCGKSLLFRSNPWVFNRYIAPNLGEIIIVHEDFFNENILLEFIKDKEIDRVVFHNPYANEKMLSLYNTVRESGIPYLVCERGALRDSIFLDHKGFNADSSSYSPELWDKEITESFREKTIEYKLEEKSTSESLEFQNVKLSNRELRKKLNISYGKKILFVPLQRPSDTVIKYFSGNIETYENFITLVNSLAHALPRDWEIVVKRHPLEVENPALKGVIYANDVNVKSLIDLSDTVLLINSGVGVLSMIYDKPIFVAGSAFYSHKDITYPVSSVEDVLLGLQIFKPCKEKTLRFLSYLINEFYSFATFQTRLVNWEGGAKMSATTAIDYYCVRFPNQLEMLLERSAVPTVQNSSPLFDRYRNPNGSIRLGDSTANKKPVVQPTPKPVAKTENNQKQVVAVQKVETVQEFIPYEVDVLQRKLNKLKKDPKQFLEDSQYKALRVIGGLIK